MTKTFAAPLSIPEHGGFASSGEKTPQASGLPGPSALAGDVSPIDRELARFEEATVAFAAVARAAGVPPHDGTSTAMIDGTGQGGAEPTPDPAPTRTAPFQVRIDPPQRGSASSPNVDTHSKPRAAMQTAPRATAMAATDGAAPESGGFAMAPAVPGVAARRRLALGVPALLVSTVLAAVVVPAIVHRTKTTPVPTSPPSPPAVNSAAQTPPVAPRAIAAAPVAVPSQPIAAQASAPMVQTASAGPRRSAAQAAATAASLPKARPDRTAAKPVSVAAAIAAAQERADRFLAAGASTPATTADSNRAK